jgi:oxazoline/thiazoline synthase
VDATTHPRFKACIEPIIDSDDGLFVLFEGRRAWMPGAIFTALAPLLDGAHEVESIFEALTDSYPAEHVLAALDHLRVSGYLAEDDAAGPRASLAFWEHAGAPPSVAHARLRVRSVSAVAVGEVDIAFLTEALVLNGLEVLPHGDCTIVVTDDYLRPALTSWNARALASGHAWLLVKPRGIETWLGPAFVPGQTACWECLAQRLRGHRRVEAYLARRHAHGAPIGAPVACLPSTERAALADAATEITRWIGSGGQSPLLNAVVSTHTLTMRRMTHVLARRPQCAACGLPGQSHDSAGPMRLRPRRKVHTPDGGHHGRDLPDVLADLERHLSPITGIVSTLERGTRTGSPSPGKRWLTPTLAADHNFSDMHDERFFLREGLRRRSGGKGRTADQARASALAEALERYCGVFDGTERRIRAAFGDLGPAAIHPNACMLYSDRQYADRESHNRRGHKATWVPEPFCEDVAIEWTPVWSLTAERTRYLPTSYCYFGYRGPDPVFARADSNGCAAGAVLEEAVLHGLLELIERDAVAIWWYNRLGRPALDLDRADDPYVADLRQHYAELRREIWALDITSDFGIPTIAALSRRVDQDEEDLIYGFGAHLDPAVALTRALTELNQSLEAVPVADGPASSQTYLGSDEAVQWWRLARAAEARYLMPDRDVAPRRLQDMRSLSSEDLCTDTRTCLDLAVSRDLEVLVLDQTRPDVGFPVVRVVAPGLRHFWARFGAGRLYDVPVEEGWLAHPLAETDLNPYVIQF